MHLLTTEMIELSADRVIRKELTQLLLLLVGFAINTFETRGDQLGK